MVLEPTGQRVRGVPRSSTTPLETPLHRLTILAITCIASLASAQQPLSHRPPPVDVDYTGVSRFYEIGDALARGTEPTPAQWDSLFATRGYRLAQQQNSELRATITVALSSTPANRARRDSLLARQGDAGLTIRHIIRAYEQRASVQQTIERLRTSFDDTVAVAITRDAKYLPSSFDAGTPVPPVGFAVFADDGYALDGGILLDPLYVKELGLTELLSHEMYHMYAGRYDRTNFALMFMTGVGSPYDATLVGALRAMRNEGLADQIDKPHPLPVMPGALAFYATRYNSEYEKTPATLRAIDSLLVVVHADSMQGRAAGQRARQLLWSNAHPAGAYVARTIVETFGVDSIFPALANPFALLRTYAAAEAKRGHPAPFSAGALAQLTDIEIRYLMPGSGARPGAAPNHRYFFGGW